MSKQNNFNTRVYYYKDELKKRLENFTEYPCTIVEAPMGYGKTSFVRESLKNIDADNLWFRVYDNNITGFWKGLCHQLEEINPNIAQSLADLGFPNDSTIRYEALSLIDKMGLHKDTVLVIDDYHIITCPEVDEFLEFLIHNEISHLYFILVSRYISFQNLEELKLKEYVLHIKKEDFEFSRKDIKAYYRLCGISLKDAEIQTLYSLTEGWISALYLIMLNYQEYGKLDTTKDLSKLIENAIYRHFSEETKKLLISLCIFESFSLEQAVFLSENENAERLLQEVITKNSFVKYENSIKNYQIHNIFTNFLQEVLQNHVTQNELYQRAAQWYLKTGEYTLAKQYFYLCQDFENIFVTIEKEKSYDLNNEDSKDRIIKYLLESPYHIKQKHPFVMIVLAFRLYAFNEMAQFGSACKEFLKIMEEDRSLNDLERNRLMGEYELLISFTAYNNIRKMESYYKKAYDLINGQSALCTQKSIWTFGAPSILYMFYSESGKLDDLLKTMYEALPYYSQVTNGNANGGEFCMDAEACFYRGDFENSLILIHKTIHKAESKNQLSNVICALFYMMRIELMKGNYDNALRIVQTMHEKITSSKEYGLFHTVEFCESYLYALLNQEHKISGWLAEGDYRSNRLLFPNYAMLNVVYGRALLIKGEYHKLLGSVEKFIHLASVFSNLLGQIHTNIYAAAASHRIFRQADALSYLCKALDIAMPDGIYIPFVENCDYIKPLLEELCKENCYNSDIAKILKLYDSYKVAVTKIEQEHFTNHRPKLSDREMEVARLAVQGFSNKEIGEELFISTNTVKMTLKKIYIKLSINNRTLLKQYLETIK